MKGKIKRKWVKLSISGLNIEKTLNTISKQDIEIVNIVKKDYHSCDFEVRGKNVKKVEKILLDRNIKTISKTKFGIDNFFEVLKLRIGIIVGLAVSLILFFIFSNCLFKIEIQGNEVLKDEEIIKCLEEFGVKKYSFFSKSNKELEEMISKSFEEISLISVVKKGNSLIVNIKEKLQNGEYEDKDNFQAMVSKFDGIITKINHIQGTLKVKVGDIVQKGEVLVEPYMIDSKGNQMPVMPKSEIYAEVYETGKTVHYDVETKNVRTGNFIRKREVFISKIQLFSEGKECDFLSFETEEKIIKVSENNLLPLYYRDIFYYEIVPTVAEVDFASVKLQKLEEAKSIAHSKILETDVIKDEYESITSLAGKTDVKYIIVVERLVSE